MKGGKIQIERKEDTFSDDLWPQVGMLTMGNYPLGTQNPTKILSPKPELLLFKIRGFYLGGSWSVNYPFGFTLSGFGYPMGFFLKKV